MPAFIRSAAALVALLALAAALLVGSPYQATAATTTIAVGDFWFCNASFAGGVCETTIHAGDTVAWDFSQAMNQHTATECGASCDSPSSMPLWNSGRMTGGTFQFTFTQAGTFLYQCQVHPLAMRGRIVVQAAPTATSTAPSATSTSPPAAGQTPSVGFTRTPISIPVVSDGLPTSGQGPQSGTTNWWLLGALAAVGVASLGLALAYRTRTR
jgi:plastocyanin